jgi:outer membrane protein W
MADNLNREAYAEVYVGAGDPHYVLYDDAFGVSLATQIGSRNSRGAQSLAAYDANLKKHYIVADNILYFNVIREKDASAKQELVSKVYG